MPTLNVPNKTMIVPTRILLAVFTLKLLLHLSLPQTIFIPSPWNFTGLIPLGSGIMINFTAFHALQQVIIIVKPFEEPSILVTHGVFSFCRNPIYLGFIGILVGIALMLGSTAPFIIIIVFALVNDHLYIKTEENNLLKKFGTD